MQKEIYIYIYNEKIYKIKSDKNFLPFLFDQFLKN